MHILIDSLVSARVFFGPLAFGIELIVVFVGLAFVWGNNFMDKFATPFAALIANVLLLILCIKAFDHSPVTPHFDAGIFLAVWCAGYFVGGMSGYMLAADRFHAFYRSGVV